MNLNLLTLPPEIEMPILLIKEELKARKLFNTLRSIGLHDCYYQIHLDSLIMACLELDTGSDETLHFYYDLIEKHSQKIEADHNTIIKEAFEVYTALMAEKNKRQGAKN